MHTPVSTSAGERPQPVGPRIEQADHATEMSGLADQAAEERLRVERLVDGVEIFRRHQPVGQTFGDDVGPPAQGMPTVLPLEPVDDHGPPVIPRRLAPHGAEVAQPVESVKRGLPGRGRALVLPEIAGRGLRVSREDILLLQKGGAASRVAQPDLLRRVGESLAVATAERAAIEQPGEPDRRGGIGDAPEGQAVEPVERQPDRVARQPAHRAGVGGPCRGRAAVRHCRGA